MTNANTMTMTLQERVAATNDAACPKVEVTIHPSRSRYDRYWVLELRCPFCAKVHSHGGGSIDHPPALGHRLSHCLNHARDYELVASIEEDPRHER
jgi:hypothetical protein